MVALALFQPDIPQNAGTLLRLGACLGTPVHVIEPAGFVFSDKTLRRAGMDYLDAATLVRHASWTAFHTWAAVVHRLVLVETDGKDPYTGFAYRTSDILILGRESAGTPPEVVADCERSVHIPMRPGLRSLNVAVAAAMVLGEALRQTGAWPRTDLT